MLPAANFPIPNIPTNCEDNLADLPPTVCTSLLSPILGFLLHGSCSHITGIPIRILCRSLSRSSREPSFSILIPFIKTSILQLFLEFGGRSRYFSVYSIYCKTEIILRTGNQTGYGCNKLSIGLFNIGHRIPNLPFRKCDTYTLW